MLVSFMHHTPRSLKNRCTVQSTWASIPATTDLIIPLLKSIRNVRLIRDIYFPLSVHLGSVGLSIKPVCMYIHTHVIIMYLISPVPESRKLFDQIEPCNLTCTERYEATGGEMNLNQNFVLKPVYIRYEYEDLKTYEICYEHLKKL